MPSIGLKKQRSKVMRLRRSLPQGFDALRQRLEVVRPRARQVLEIREFRNAFFVLCTEQLVS